MAASPGPRRTVRADRRRGAQRQDRGQADVITFEQAMQARNVPDVAGITAAGLGARDMMNLILQRSEIIRDHPRANGYIKAWSNGDEAPILDLVAQIGEGELLRRAAAFIYLEYQELKPHLHQPEPGRIADIGCGYALFDLFLARDHGTKLVLIDLETNDKRHFGFQSEGAAYSNLEQAREFLIANGVDKSLIDLRNPETDDLSDIAGLDYVFSFISCGFHYPWDTYLDFYRSALSPGGRIILDMRARRLAQALPDISRLGVARHLVTAANGSAERIVIAPQL
jgi:SAM-dependent methyltransferase